MADPEEWFVGEDGCLSIEKPVNNITYHPNLNTILVSTKEPALYVLDVTSGSVLKTSDLSVNRPCNIKCTYLPGKDVVLFTDEAAVGMRKDANGILMLDSALQTPVSKTEDMVKVELSLPEATKLFKCLMSAELPGVDYVDEVLRELEKEIETVKQETKANHKVAMWATVCLKLSHCALKTVCSSLVMELKRLHHHVPGLPIASAIADRLSYLLPSAQPEVAGGGIDRSLMYSEAARRETFAKWPHMNYKWALPDAMAQAGFYHQPTSTGDDRAMCFTCNVCLVCWEPTDEPWSEHERHSPTCPFVKGEHTQNVPLLVTYATEPALPHAAKGGKEKIICMSTTSCDDFIATSTLNGNIVVWNLTRQLKKHIQFNLDPWEPVIAAKLGLQPLPVKDGSPKKVPAVSSASVETKTTETKPSEEKEIAYEENKEEDTTKQEAGEAGSKSTKSEPVVEIPLNPEPISKRCVLQRCRPSQDVLVSALCILAVGEGSADKKKQTIAAATSSAGASNQSTSSSLPPHPCLVSGVAIRRSTMSEAEEEQDVQAMNEVNQAISGQVTPLIDDTDTTSSTNTVRPSKPNPFVPYLLVHEIGTSKSRRDLKNKGADKVASSSSTSGSSGTKVSSLASTVQDLYMPQMPQIMEMEEEGSLLPPSGVHEINDYFKTIPPLAEYEDDDVQIVGMQFSELGPYQVGDEEWKMMNGPGMGPMAMPPPVETKTVISENSLTLPSVTGPKDGRVRQCIELPSQVTSDQYIVSITPTADSSHIIVVTAPKWQHTVIGLASGSVEVAEQPEGLLQSGASLPNSSASSSCGGCLLVYKVAVKTNVIGIEEKPLQISIIENSDDSIQSLLLLPSDISSGLEEEDLSPRELDQDTPTQEEIQGQVALITYTGAIKILRLADCKVLARIQPPEGDKFVSLTYCAGMNRLCASTKEGKLVFYVIAARVDCSTDCDLLMNDLPSKTSASQAKEDSMDGPDNLYRMDDLLVKQPLTTENLMLLHDLTQFENLMPRFSATVPPCWSEIQQEQQQRRHPQHLQQQGEAMQHTRTWRLQQDGTSWDEHLFEVVLPKSCSVGHIDLKFSLHPFCLNAPHIEVTLLKQNLNSIGRVVFDKSAVSKEEGGSIQDEPDTGQPSTAEASHKPASSSSSSVIHNTVLDPDFLKHYGAEILCGPVDLRNQLDLSGHSGLVTLTSSQLLKTKSRSFLVHLKAMSASTTSSILSDKEKAKWSMASQVSEKIKEGKSVIASKPENWEDPVWFGFTPTPTVTDRLASSVNKHKMEQFRGCDWIQEVSITIRRTKKALVSRERLQRVALLETSAIHEQLVVAACGVEDKLGVATSKEHRQGLALDVLTWITSLQMNERFNKSEKICVLFPIQNNLKGLVKSCFIEAGRSVAHKCAKLIALSIEYAKNLNEESLAPSFNYMLLQALLEILPCIPCAYSSGALRWYFTLLNRVKCMDVSLMSNKCADLLHHVAKHYKDRINPLHSLLKTRFGLYGSPLDSMLFDMDPPSLAVPASTPSYTYCMTHPASGTVISSNNAGLGAGAGPVLHGGMTSSSMVAANTMVTSSISANASQAGAGQDEVDLRDLMFSTSEKGSRSQFSYIQRHVCGLLEVEPLHFTCHATSDGTRMERMDTAGASATTTSALSGLSGTINFGEALQGPTTATAALAHLSSALTSAEQQLQILQQKQQQLYKIQQKLYGGSNKSMPGSAQSASPYEYLPPPTPKTTPQFMTPPVTPPNESLLQVFSQAELDPGKPPLSKKSAFIVNKLNDVKDHMKSHSSSGKSSSQCQTPPSKNTLPIAQTHNLLQPPPPQVLVIERMHSGARRFVVLDFGKPILLTDLIIPACGDLASLSIDVWTQAEEQDGQRLVVSSDIGMRSLIMNDLMPPPVCRYLKITTIGRYGGSTTKSRIPIGSFYGYTTILPWECDSSLNSNTSSANGATNSSSLVVDHSQIFTRLGTLLGLQEDLQCRYSLASNRLMSLLNMIETPLNNNSHTHYYLRKTKKADDDSRIQQAYQDCIQLQLQLNLVQHAAERLQKVLGLHSPGSSSQSDTMSMLQQASTDKLRVLTELLLDSLLGMSNPSPSIPRLPVSLYNHFTPETCEALFRNLCINGTRKMQIHTGLLLVRLCGNAPWWGEFLGAVLQQYFSSEQPEIFPQDRVFVLLTALGQKSASGCHGNDMLENILSLLGKLVSPLVSPSNSPYRPNAAQLDLSLIGWLLLFLTRNLDNSSNNASDDGDKTASSSKDKDNNGSSTSRWDFLQGEAAMANSRQNAKGNSSKVYRRKLQKRLMHHKQQLLDLQQAKKTFMTLQMEKSAAGGLSKETEALLKQQEQIFKKQIKQYSSKHFKDIMQIKRINGELLKKMPKGQESNSNGGEKEGGENEGDVSIVISREKCVPVVRGLMALLLSMDFTCNVDLFLITCKVVARLTNVTRPAISLSEVMSQEELERLVMLCCNVEFNHGNVTWGGSWAGHAITCLLQDILDGEKMYPACQGNEGVTDDDMSSYSETDTSLPCSNSLPSMDTDASSATAASSTANDTSGASGGKQDDTFKFDEESSLWVDMMVDEKETEEKAAKFQEFLPSDLLMGKWMEGGKPLFNVINFNPAAKNGSGTINWGPPPPITFGDDKKPKFDSWKSKFSSLVDNSNVSSNGVSTAMDARLEIGVDQAAELRLKVMISLETDSIHTAISAPLPPPVTNGHSQASNSEDDSLPDMTAAFLHQQKVIASHEMLRICFNNLFSQLQMQRVNLETLLLTWLTLNDESPGDDATQVTPFDPSKVPFITLQPEAVSSLLTALAWAPAVPVRTWVLAFHTLTLLANTKYSSGQNNAHSLAQPAGDRWMANVMVADSNLMTMLLKFLSSSSVNSTALTGSQTCQVGPTGTRAFHEFLVRLQLRCAESNENHLKELVLKLVYTLSAERGAFHSGLGPLDAQCKLLDYMLEQSYETVDINNALSVIETLSMLVYQHIICQEKVVCRSTSESSISARSCFGGLFANILRGPDTKMATGDSSRDVLMCSLLKLVNKLVQIPVPGRGNPRRGTSSSVSGFNDIVTQAPDYMEDSLMTDASKISQSLGAAPVGNSAQTSGPKSDEEKVLETDEQKTESNSRVQSCSHYTDVRNPQADNKEVTVSDIVLQHPQIVGYLIQALSCCNSNTMAMILGSSSLQGNMQDTFSVIDPISVGDGIFHILSTLNRKATDIHLIVSHVMEYLASGFQGNRLPGISRLSEPLLWFILRVLDCDYTIKHFLELGGVEIVCQNLVQSSHQVISVSPSLISTMMQYLGNTKSSAAAAALKKSTLDTETGEELQNFAPLCTVTSSSPTAGPADVLIQASPPHRRARSAAWSYHFYPEEAWVDLTLTLPCAVLLKEIHIQPHLTSLATCPAAVSVEVSRDGTSSIPICSPIQTSGLTLVKLQLLKSEVVTSVTIRLHKPRDSATIGLSKIMLLGSTAFADSGPLRTSNFLLPSEDYVSKSSIGWLRLLHHCLMRCEGELSAQVAAAAAHASGLLVTCTALLVSSSAVQLYATNIEAVLLKIGLHSNDMGLVLIDHILRNTNLAPHHRDMPLHGKVNGVSNESTVDILFKLGTRQDEGTESRLKALLDWLSDSARVGLQKSQNPDSPNRETYSGNQQHTDLPTPAPGHIHCIAAILWHSHELPVTYNLPGLLNRELLSCLYEWSVMLPVECSLKKAVNSVICSMCHIHPEYFTSLLGWMGVVVQLDMNAALTDDHKDSRHHQPSARSQESMTDDSKEATVGLYQSINLLHLTLTNLMLDESHLSTLAVACQSPQALQQLLGYGFPAILCQGLYEFCLREANQEQLINLEVHTDAAKTSSQGCSGSSSPSQTYTSRQHSESESHSASGLHITSDLVAPVLRFFAEVSKEEVMKDWLGSPEGSVFWPNLLHLLCNTMPHTSSSQQQSLPKTKAMTSEQRAAIETATVAFFTNVISCHPENQQTFASVLCEVIRAQPAATNSFTRRLFLQVLLEDERVMVCMRSSMELYKGSQASSASVATLGHPRCGAGHCFRTIHASLQTTCSDLLTKVSDTPSLTTQLLEERGERRSSEDKDASQRGLEVVDLISAAAGLHAKEKREKDKHSNPPRPPSRRGHRPPDQALSVGVNLPTLTLYHPLLSGQGLPGDLTLSQLLVLLHERGFAHGQSTIELHLRLKGRKKSNGRPQPGVSDDNGLSEDALLATQSFPSALQVFAGVGGLALLAEHLPLLYPEVLRQVSPPPSASDNVTSNTHSDWVTVESAEDIYEDIYEPMPAQHMGSSSKPCSQMISSIPPHSLVAFGLFLRLPGYAEVLLKERKRAQCLLRLVLGVTDDGQGGHILTSPVAGALPTLPFNVLKTLYDTTPLTTDDGVLLRRMSLEIGVIHLLLACLSVLSHQAPRSNIPGIHNEAGSGGGNGSSGTAGSGSRTQEDKSQNYWAKGTGFGTGSTTSSWDAEQAFLRQRSEEEHVTCLLQVLSSYINPGGLLPKAFDPNAEQDEIDEEDETRQHMPEVLSELLSHSCLVPSICSYLRNDSVLDMARHVPLYRALLELLRALAVSPSLVCLLLPLETEEDTSCISSLLSKMKNCVDTYDNRLRSNKNKGNGVNKNKQEEEESEGLALLIPDIQETARIVHTSTSKLRRDRSAESVGRDESDSTLILPGSVQYNHSDEERYISAMKELQFDTYEIVTDEDGVIKFNAPHHYESNVKAAGDVNNASRARRLAQEAVTLSTSLPLSASSSVFVRCDEERLDVMKVLITGPSDTPYANGCFEFDVYFPQDYPNSPPLINLETTGNHTVRFNPNLYNDGKVCLSVLNTWHGRPEEKWNSQTSSFLQVLVSIQSLILVPEPYFNEPGYERSRGTPSGSASSREYDANIRQATVKWAMLEQLRNPSPCFKEVIEHHFWLKRHEITSQIEAWLGDMESGSSDKRSGRTISHSCVALKRHYNQLKEELAKMRPPKELEEDEGIQSAEAEVLHPPPPAPVSPSPQAVPSHSSTSQAPPLMAEATAWYPPEKMPVKHVLNGPKSAPPLMAAIENDLEDKDQSSSSESTSTEQSMSSSTEDYHPTIKC